MRRLARAARAAGRDPAADPIPGLRRDVIFCSTADEEAGGWQGANWLVDEHPDWLRAAGALNEAGGFAHDLCRRPLLPDPGRREGLRRLQAPRQAAAGATARCRPPDNAAVLAAQIVTRLSEPGPMRLTEAMGVSVARAIPHLTARAAAALQTPRSPNEGPRSRERSRRHVRELCDPVLARTISAMIHDTVSVGIIRAGVKYNVIPGTAEIEIDCRTLPGTDEPAMRAELRRRIGEELWARIEVECEQVGPSVQAPLDGPLYPAARAGPARPRPAGRAAAVPRAVRDGRQAPCPDRRPDLRLLAAPARKATRGS